MTTEQRKQKILDMLKEKDSVRVSNLSRILGVSEVTIRSYLEDMEKKGLLSRVHGGAVSSYKPYYSMNLNQRLETNKESKVAIAERVVELIQPNDTVMLNAGTTTLMVFRKLPQNYNLSIVTNSISIALEAEGNPNFNVILVGGSVNSKYQFSYGSDAIEQIKKYHADKLILSVDGISAEHGFTTYYDKEASVDVAMIEQSNCRIIAADHSKFGHSAFVKISDAAVADYIVTNDQLSRELTEELNKQGVTILC
jgi:DeoR/GlpR family transcriptional regulator of sugar metabolism